MAADGAEPAEEDGRAGRSIEQLRAATTEIEGRLGAPTPGPPRVESTEALVRAVDALGRQLSRLEETTADRYGQVTRSLKTLAQRLDAQAEAQAATATRMRAGESQVLARLEAAEAQLAAQPALPRDPAPIRLILTLASGAAALAIMGVSTALLLQLQAPSRMVRPSSPATASPPLPLRPGLASLGSAVEPASRPIPTPVRPAPPAAAAHDTYAAAAAALARGEATALARLTGLATAGDTQAERHLAGLYEVGAAGLARDATAARAWTERAARGGDRLAMHNLALFLAQGEGGPADAAQAAAWFRRAAERGVVDSQFNLGLMYEAGRGVERNLGEAYRWFAIAANAGDLAAREKQVAMEGRLAAGERAGLDREAAGFQPGAPAPGLAVVIPPATTVAETQALLARQGYYLGPADGAASPALRAATAAYLRDHPGAAKGAL